MNTWPGNRPLLLLYNNTNLINFERKVYTITLEERIAQLEKKVYKTEEFISRLKFALEVNKGDVENQEEDNIKQQAKQANIKAADTDYEELPEILTAQNIADYLGISRRQVYDLFKTYPEAGGIVNFNIGYSKRVEKKDFISWIEERKQEKAKGRGLDL